MAYPKMDRWEVSLPQARPGSTGSSKPLNPAAAAGKARSCQRRRWVWGALAPALDEHAQVQEGVLCCGSIKTEQTRSDLQRHPGRVLWLLGGEFCCPRPGW